MARSIKRWLIVPAVLGAVAAGASAQAGAACVAGGWQQPPNLVFDAVNGSFPVRAESAHFVLRWPANKPSLLAPDEAQRALEAMERIYAWFVGPAVRWPEPFCNTDKKYKFTIFTNDGYGLAGSGNSANGVEAPAMWVGPGALRDAATGLGDRIGGMVHEFTHAMQFASRGMRNTEFGGWFWESHAEFMAAHYPGNDGKVGCTSLSAWQPHLYYGSTRVRYCNWQFWTHIKNKHGFDAINNIWAKTAGLFGQDPLAALMRNQGWSAAQLGDEFGEYAMRNVAWEYVDVETGFDRGRAFRAAYGPNTDLGANPDWTVSKRLRLAPLAPIDVAKRRFVVPSYVAPQRYGYNHVRLIPDAGSTAVTVNFRGVVQQRIAAGAEVGGTMAQEPGATPNWREFPMPQTPASNWRWGVVVIEASGKVRYSPLQRGSSGSLRMPLLSTDREVYLAVAATPDDFHGVFWDQKYNTLYRYPYKVELLGALPEGYQPNFDIRTARQYPPGRPHPNGGGWVADTARVSASAYVGPNAAVLGGQVLGNARIEDHAIVWNGTVQDNAVVGGLTQLNANATVADSAVIRSVMAGGQTWNDRDVIRGTAVLFGDLETHTLGVPVTKGSFSGFNSREMFTDPAHGALRTRLPVEVTAPVPAGWPDPVAPPPPVVVPPTPPSGSVRCARDGQACTIPARRTATVWYGSTSFVWRTGMGGRFQCRASTFGAAASPYRAWNACWYRLNP